MDGAVDAAAADQRMVRRVDDGVDVKRRDVGDQHFQPGRTDFGSEKGSGHGGKITRYWGSPQPAWGEEGSGKGLPAARPSPDSLRFLPAKEGCYARSAVTSARRSTVLRVPMSSKCASRKRRAARRPC